MQDRYVGDVGDFGKYGLLNEIYKKSNGSVRLGINWFYNTKEEKKRGEGKGIDGGYRYLRDEKYKVCFLDLHNKLNKLGIVDRTKRSIKGIEKGQILPKETIFYSEPLPWENRFEREGNRKNWFKESLSQLKGADIIFLDPDNGVQTDKVRKTQIKAIKYVFRDEIKEYYELGKSFIIYNHRDRNSKSEYNRKIRDSLGQIKFLVLRFKRFQVRHFIFLIQKDHRDLIEQTIDYLRKEPYDFLFEIYTLD